MNDLMPRTLQSLCKALHRHKKSGDLLQMVFYVVLLLMQLCDEVGDVV